MLHLHVRQEASTQKANAYTVQSGHPVMMEAPATNAPLEHLRHIQECHAWDVKPENSVLWERDVKYALLAHSHLLDQPNVKIVHREQRALQEHNL